MHFADTSENEQSVQTGCDEQLVDYILLHHAHPFDALATPPLGAVVVCALAFDVAAA